MAKSFCKRDELTLRSLRIGRERPRSLPGDTYRNERCRENESGRTTRTRRIREITWVIRRERDLIYWEQVNRRRDNSGKESREAGDASW